MGYQIFVGNKTPRQAVQDYLTERNSGDAAAAAAVAATVALVNQIPANTSPDDAQRILYQQHRENPHFQDAFIFLQLVKEVQASGQPTFDMDNFSFSSNQGMAGMAARGAALDGVRRSTLGTRQRIAEELIPNAGAFSTDENYRREQALALLTRVLQQNPNADPQQILAQLNNEAVANSGYGAGLTTGVGVQDIPIISGLGFLNRVIGTRNSSGYQAAEDATLIFNRLLEQAPQGTPAGQLGMDSVTAAANPLPAVPLQQRNYNARNQAMHELMNGKTPAEREAIAQLITESRQATNSGENLNNAPRVIAHLRQRWENEPNNRQQLGIAIGVAFREYHIEFHHLRGVTSMPPIDYRDQAAVAAYLARSGNFGLGHWRNDATMIGANAPNPQEQGLGPNGPCPAPSAGQSPFHTNPNMTVIPGPGSATSLQLTQLAINQVMGAPEARHGNFFHPDRRHPEFLQRVVGLVNQYRNDIVDGNDEQRRAAFIALADRIGPAGLNWQEYAYAAAILRRAREMKELQRQGNQEIPVFANREAFVAYSEQNLNDINRSRENNQPIAAIPSAPAGPPTTFTAESNPLAVAVEQVMGPESARHTNLFAPGNARLHTPEFQQRVLGLVNEFRDAIMNGTDEQRRAGYLALEQRIRESGTNWQEYSYAAAILRRGREIKVLQGQGVFTLPGFNRDSFVTFATQNMREMQALRANNTPMSETPSATPADPAADPAVGTGTGTGTGAGTGTGNGVLPDGTRCYGRDATDDQCYGPYGRGADGQPVTYAASRATRGRVREAQEQLIRLGYDTGRGNSRFRPGRSERSALDGIVGDKTNNSIKAFQEAYNSSDPAPATPLPTDGGLDDATMEALRAARPARGAARGATREEPAGSRTNRTRNGGREETSDISSDISEVKETIDADIQSGGNLDTDEQKSADDVLEPVEARLRSGAVLKRADATKLGGILDSLKGAGVKEERGTDLGDTMVALREFLSRQPRSGERAPDTR